LHGEKTAIENTLAEPHSYDDANKDRLKEILLRQGQISGELEQLEAEWLDLHEELEALATND
jgi:ATP-binding cassette subfamily F protein 3